MDIFDPTSVTDNGTFEEWQAKIRGIPNLGSLLTQNPQRAAEVLASKGVPPPPLPVDTGYSEAGGGSAPLAYSSGGPPLPVGGRLGGAQLPGGLSSPALTPAPAPEVGKQLYPAGATDIPWEPLFGPETQPKPVTTTTENPLEPVPPPGPMQGSPAPGGGAAPSRTNPSDLEKTLQGLRAIAPPAVSPVSTPNPAQAHLPTQGHANFAPAPGHGGGGAQPINPLALLQALAVRSGPPLTQLLRRG